MSLLISAGRMLNIARRIASPSRERRRHRRKVGFPSPSQDGATGRSRGVTSGPRAPRRG